MLPGFPEAVPLAKLLAPVRPVRCRSSADPSTDDLMSPLLPDPSELGECPRTPAAFRPAIESATDEENALPPDAKETWDACPRRYAEVPSINESLMDLWLRILENFKIKIRNTSKISKYKIHFEKAKISKYPKISRFSENFQNLVRRISAIFEVLTHFPHFFRVDLEKS